jgi:hypothetical protein
MFAILHSLTMFVIDFFKSPRRLEADNLFLRHQLSIASRRAPPRAAMVWGVDWTGERVAERLVAAFRAMPGISIYSPSKGVFEPSRPIDGLELITVVQLCLGRESRECRDLLTWARLKAKAGDVSIREALPPSRPQPQIFLLSPRPRP